MLRGFIQQRLYKTDGATTEYIAAWYTRLYQTQRPKRVHSRYLSQGLGL